MWKKIKNLDVAELASKILVDLLNSESNEPYSYLTYELGIMELKNLTNDLTNIDVGIVVSTLKEEKVALINAFNVFEERCNQIVTKRVRKDATLVIPLRLKIPKSKFTFYGRQYEIRETEELFGKENAKSLPTYSFSLIVKSYSIEDAWKQVSPEIDVLLGIVSYSYFYHKAAYTCDFSKRNKIEDIRSIFWKSGDSSNELKLETYINDNDKLILEIPNNEIFNNLIALFNNRPSDKSTLFLISISLRLYSDAMKSFYRYSAFLHFWQLIEAISLAKNANGSTSKVLSILSMFTRLLKLRGGTLKNTLQVFADKRNSLVHRGVNEFDDDDVNFMKVLCELAINWLIENEEKFSKISHLEKYYKYKNLGNKELDDMIFVARDIKTNSL